jgi:hypothetical protein
MEKIEIRPGQILNIVHEVGVRTPFGNQDQEVVVASVDYDSIIKLLAPKKPRKKQTPGVYFSRRVSLAATALRTGKWPSGAPISASAVVDGLFESFKALNPRDYSDITDKAMGTLTLLYIDATLDERIKRTIDIIVTSITNYGHQED